MVPALAALLTAVSAGAQNAQLDGLLVTASQFTPVDMMKYSQNNYSFTTGRVAAMGGVFTGLALAIGAAASVAAALMAVAGEPVIRLVSCVLNLVYALICFIVSGNGAVFAVCGFVMLAASAAAAVSLAAGHLRDWLAAYPAAKISAGDYTFTGEPEAAIMPEAEPEPVEPAKPPEPSELMLIAEKVSGIMNSRSSRSAQENTTEVHSGESAQG